MNYKLLGEKIREQRKNKNYTLEQLAEKLGVSTTFIGQIERAKGKPSLETVVKIANVLGVSVDYLIFADLRNEASDVYFIEQVKSLTQDFESKQKQLVLKSIETLKEFK